MSPRSTILPLHFWNFGSNSAYLRWQMSIIVAKWTFFLSLCASRISSFLLLTFFNCQAGIVSNFFHSFSNAAFASKIFIAWGKRKTCEPNCNGSSSCILCLRCGLHHLSVGMIPDVVSWTHATPRYMHALFLKSCWIHNFPLQFPEASNASPPLLCTALTPPLELPTFSSHSWRFLYILRFGSSIAHSCFYLLWAAFPIWVHTASHIFRSVVASFVVSISPDHIYPVGGFSLNNVSFVNPVQEPDKLRSACTFQ